MKTHSKPSQSISIFVKTHTYFTQQSDFEQAHRNLGASKTKSDRGKAKISKQIAYNDILGFEQPRKTASKLNESYRKLPQKKFRLYTNFGLQSNLSKLVGIWEPRQQQAT